MISELVRPVVERWRPVVGVAIAFGALGVILRLLLPVSYEAQVTFVPQASRNSGLGSVSGLASLASQLGVTVPTVNPTLSPSFFAAVLRSRQVLESVLDAKLAAPSTDGRQQPESLLAILRIKKRRPAERRDVGIRWLLSHTAVAVDRQTGIITLTVRSHYPGVSADIANLLVATLDSFNIQRLQLQSREQRLFTERRLADAQREVRAAEGALLQFLTTNRTYAQSPTLRVEEGRLERDVQLKQDVYTTLSKAYEEARIAEVQDTPLLTIIDRAEPPVRPSTLSVPRVFVIALILGAFAGGIWALWREHRVAGGPERA